MLCTCSGEPKFSLNALLVNHGIKQHVGRSRLGSRAESDPTGAVAIVSCTSLTSGSLLALDRCTNALIGAITCTVLSLPGNRSICWATYVVHTQGWCQPIGIVYEILRMLFGKAHLTVPEPGVLSQEELRARAEATKKPQIRQPSWCWSIWVEGKSPRRYPRRRWSQGILSSSHLDLDWVSSIVGPPAGSALWAPN